MAKIRKIKEKELIGGTSDIEVYPITHARAVYDKNNTPLSDTLEFLNTEIVWNNSGTLSNMNDFVVAGVYDIKGEHTRVDDNLPVLNTGGGHSFNARLTVLDSSISGSGEDDDKCITQVLSFSNRLGQGEVYIRTGKGSSLDNLSWEKWSTLQRNMNVDAVTSLDHLVDNGIYSGVLIPTGETFVLVVINNYAFASKHGTQKCISQFKYSVDPFGAVSFGKRVKTGNTDFPAEWDILNRSEIDKMLEDAVKQAIANVTNGAPETFDTLKEIADWITNDETGAVALANATRANAAAITAERTRAIGQEGLLNNAIAEEKSRAEQAEQTLDNKITAEVNRAQQAEQAIKDKAVEADSLNFQPRANAVALDYKTIEGVDNEITIPTATTEKAGVMSAEDKEKLTELASNLSEIQVEESSGKEIEVSLETEEGEVWFNVNKDRANFKRITQNEVDVLTKETGVEAQNTQIEDSDEEILLKSSKTQEEILRINNNGLYTSLHFLDGTSIQQIWGGKNLAGYGDSITQYNYKSGDVDGQAGNGWMPIVKGFFNFNKTYNRGIEGTTMGYYLASDGKIYSNGSNVSSDGETSKSISVHRAMCSWDRIVKSFPETIKDTIDVVFVMGGTNDFANYFKPSDVPFKVIDGVENGLPEWSSSNTYDAEWASAEENVEGGDFDVQTYSGAVCSLILKMQRWMPKAKLVLMTPPIHHVSYYVKDGGGEIVRVADQKGTNANGATKYDMAIAVKRLANYMGVPCIDLYGECGINTFNAHLWLSDGIHVNGINYKEAGIVKKNGYSQIARVMIGKIVTLYPNSWQQYTDDGKNLRNN